MSDDPEIDDYGEPQTIPPPMTVAEILARQESRSSRVPEGYLDSYEVGLAWPVVWTIWPVLNANHVGRQQVSTALTSGETINVYYAAEDVQRVQDEIAAGTARLDPAWRRDTAEGRAAFRAYERRQSLKRAIGAVAVCILLLAAFLLLITVLSQT
ncbi:hypothetical protein AB0M43_15895 [Longispora sp. NPDC051575]|uniref:hypothetical protein n=1 Tax=Longispora sp. NPDC051575 TaxID=3154943 RepID=UPI0034138340